MQPDQEFLQGRALDQAHGIEKEASLGVLAAVVDLRKVRMIDLRRHACATQETQAISRTDAAGREDLQRDPATAERALARAIHLAATAAAEVGVDLVVAQAITGAEQGRGRGVGWGVDCLRWDRGRGMGLFEEAPQRVVVSEQALELSRESRPSSRALADEGRTPRLFELDG